MEFKATMSKADNCICTACFAKGRVIKLQLPETCYHNGGPLSTKYTNYWLCDECRVKLIRALEGGEGDG